MNEISQTLVIKAPPAAVLDAFFDAEALAIWWQVTRCVCVPRPLGSYAVEWEPTPWSDELVGRLGGTFHATVMEFKPGREFFLADAYWLPPDGEPIGPMALEATCRLNGDTTLLHVRQSGCDVESARWTRYYELLSPRWTESLQALKAHLEERWSA